MNLYVSCEKISYAEALLAFDMPVVDEGLESSIESSMSSISTTDIEIEIEYEWSNTPIHVALVPYKYMAVDLQEHMVFFTPKNGMMSFYSSVSGIDQKNIAPDEDTLTIDKDIILN